MIKAKVIFENPPEGFEKEAEWRLPKKGDYFIANNVNAPEQILCADEDWCSCLRIVLTPKNPPRFRAKVGETYWVIDSFGHFCRIHERGDERDQKYWDIGNYFKHRKDAQTANWRVRQALVELQLEIMDREEGR